MNLAALVRRADQIALLRKRARTRELAEQLRGLLGSGAVEVEEARVLVRGRGMIKRWLIDPSLRFLAGGGK